MPMTPTLLTTLTDLLAGGFLALKGDSTSGKGAGDSTLPLTSDWGLSRASRDFQAAVLASGDLVLINSLLDPNSDFVKNTNAASLSSSYLYAEMLKLAARCNAAGLTGVVDIATFAAYYNSGAGGPANCLLAPEFDLLYQALYRGVSVGAGNLYAPTQANMGQRSVAGALAPGSAISPTSYAGAALSIVLVSSYASGAGGNTLTVTGTARDASGTVQASRTFTASVTGNGTQPLSPTTGGDLLLSVTGITLPASMTAGTAVVIGMVPSGRPSPPNA